MQSPANDTYSGFTAFFPIIYYIHTTSLSKVGWDKHYCHAALLHAHVYYRGCFEAPPCVVIINNGYILWCNGVAYTQINTTVE